MSPASRGRPNRRRRILPTVAVLLAATTIGALAWARLGGVGGPGSLGHWGPTLWLSLGLSGRGGGQGPDPEHGQGWEGEGVSVGEGEGVADELAGRGQGSGAARLGEGSGPGIGAGIGPGIGAGVGAGAGAGAGVSEAPIPLGWPAGTPLAAVAGHEGERAEIWALHNLIAPVAENNTVILIPANAGYMHLALNLVCRLRALGSRNMLLWALDGEVYHQLQGRGIPSYFDPKLNITQKWAGFRDAEYVKIMRERPKVWWRVLATGHNMLFLDADSVALRGPQQWFPRLADLEIQMDGWEGWENVLSKPNVSDVCAGVFWARASERALRFMDVVKSSLENCERLGFHKVARSRRCDDQVALNAAVHNPEISLLLNATGGRLGGLGGQQQQQQDESEIEYPPMRVGVQDPRVIYPGHLARHGYCKGRGYESKFFYKRKKKGGQIRLRPVLLHLNGYGSIHEKVKLMRKYKWWELDNSSNCRATTAVWSVRSSPPPSGT